MSLKEWKSLLFGQIYFSTPPSAESQTIVHFSDTPSFIYHEIDHFLKRVKPAYVILTGDLCDNIKLRKHPSLLMRYEQNLFVLAEILKSHSLKAVYICHGLDDAIHSIRKIFPFAILVEPGASIQIENQSFTLAHAGQDVLTNPSRFNLFGNDYYLKSHTDEHRTYLNGLQAIHMIDTKTWSVQNIPYQMGTDGTRFNGILF